MQPTRTIDRMMYGTVRFLIQKPTRIYAVTQCLCKHDPTSDQADLPNMLGARERIVLASIRQARVRDRRNRLWHTGSRSVCAKRFEHECKKNTTQNDTYRYINIVHGAIRFPAVFRSIWKTCKKWSMWIMADSAHSLTFKSHTIRIDDLCVLWAILHSIDCSWLVNVWVCVCALGVNVNLVVCSAHCTQEIKFNLSAVSDLWC